jgi:hypothetical protein
MKWPQIPARLIPNAGLSGLPMSLLSITFVLSGKVSAFKTLTAHSYDRWQQG